MISIAEKAEILGKLDATNRSSEEAIANHLMMLLRGYSFRSSSIVKEDAKVIVDTLQAYAKLLQDAGVKVA